MHVEAPSSAEDRALEPIARVVEIAEERGETTAVQRLRTLETRLASRVLHVAVLGEFKRGKSTLVNALLGEEVLPTGVLPLTSVVTRVRWGEIPSVTILFSDGTSTVIAVDEISRFVTESENPGNRLGVDIAEVKAPSDLLRGNVVILDTPGVGSTFEQNTQATLELLPTSTLRSS